MRWTYQWHIKQSIKRDIPSIQLNSPHCKNAQLQIQRQNMYAALDSRGHAAWATNGPPYTVA